MAAADTVIPITAADITPIATAGIIVEDMAAHTEVGTIVTVERIILMADINKILNNK
jgi:hypothetical protein